MSPGGHVKRAGGNRIPWRHALRLRAPGEGGRICRGEAVAWGDIVGGMPQVSLVREHAEKQDAADPLAGFRDRFALDDPSLVYLNGNSLGALPRDTLRRLEEVIREEWGTALARPGRSTQ